jgi:hypothetical protein
MNFAYGAFTLSGRLSQNRSGSVQSILQSLPRVHAPGLGSSHFARRYFGNRCCFLFLRLLRCFSSPGSLPYTMDSCMDTSGLLMPGFPIQISRGSKDICSSPRLFAAYHVFHRLLVPRHPPYALSSWLPPISPIPSPVIVPSAAVSVLTVVFGMGTGVTPLRIATSYFQQLIA